MVKAVRSIKQKYRSIGFTQRANFYASYLRSEEWKKKSIYFRNYFGNTCSKCHTTNYIGVHHLNYECLGNETVEDVQLLCWHCHEKLHKKGFKPKFIRRPPMDKIIDLVKENTKKEK